MPLNAHVSTGSGQQVTIAAGGRLVFGRGPGVDLAVAAGRGLSRRAGVVTAMPAGVWIANISRTHALYVEGDGYRVRLPRMEDDGEPADGWFVHTGTAYVGSRAMLDEQQPLAVTVTGQFEGWSSGAPQADGAIPAAGLTYRAWAPGEARLTGGTALGEGAGLTNGAEVVNGAALTHGAELSSGPGVAPTGGAGQTGTGQGGTGQGGAGQGGTGQSGAGLATGAGLAEEDAVADATGMGTLLPFYIDPMTKLFLVALIWCSPWLLDHSATRPLPRTPEIARSALEVTGAYHELERFDSDPEFHDLLSARVAEHIKVLRRKIADHGLAGADVRLSDEVAVRILIDHGIITNADLSWVDDPAWRSRQEDLWWTQG